jgi:hypothetical protein
VPIGLGDRGVMFQELSVPLNQIKTPARERANSTIFEPQLSIYNPRNSLWAELKGSISIRDLLSRYNKPIILIAIKPDGCPMAKQFQPFLNKLAQAVGTEAIVVNLVSGNLLKAKGFADSNQSNYLHLADPYHDVLGKLPTPDGAIKSDSVFLISRDGTLQNPSGKPLGISPDTFSKIASFLQNERVDPKVLEGLTNLNLTRLPSYPFGCALTPEAK